MLWTVFVPIASSGRSSSTFGSLAVRWNNASLENLVAGCNRATDVVALRVHAVEGRRRAEVDDEERAAVALDGGDGVDDPIGADLLRVVRPHAHPGAEPCPIVSASCSR